MIDTTLEAIPPPNENEVTREELHRRQLDLRFYRRSDGLYEIVGQMMDTKSHPFMLALRTQPVEPGDPIHHMVFTLVLDESLVVKDAFAQMKATPFGVCLGAQNTVGGLIGLRIGPGWNKKVRDVLGGTASCTHLMELLGPMATTAFQGIAPKRLEEASKPENEHMRVVKVNSCFAYDERREVVANLWPHLHKPAGD